MLRQGFHPPLDEAELQETEAFFLARRTALVAIFNDCSSSSRISNLLADETMKLTQQPRTFGELGVNH